MVDRKKIREIVGYTRDKQVANPDVWYSLASSFHLAAKVLDECREKIPSDTRPFVLNAALSIELILKAVLARKKLPIPDDGRGHNLQLLCDLARINLSVSQKATLEILSKLLVWAGRYPGPKTEDQWDEYHDSIFEKHVVRSANAIRANSETFPDWANYARVWNVCVLAFKDAS